MCTISAMGLCDSLWVTVDLIGRTHTPQPESLTKRASRAVDRQSMIQLRTLSRMRLVRGPLIAGLTIAVLSTASCAMSPTPVADAVIDRVTGDDQAEVVKDACREIARNAQTANESIDDLLANLSLSDPAVEAAAESGSQAGANLASAWAGVYKAVAGRDQNAVYSATETVFEVCGTVGVNMSWGE